MSTGQWDHPQTVKTRSMLVTGIFLDCKYVSPFFFYYDPVMDDSPDVPTKI